MAEINKNYENMPRFGLSGMGRQRFTPHEKPKDTRKTVKRLLKLLLMWRRSMLAAVLLTISSSLIAICVPLLLGKAVNTFDINTGNIDRPLLFVILFSLAGCYLAGWMIDTVNAVLMAKVTQKLVRQIRLQLFAKLQKLPLNFYDVRPTATP